MPKPTFEHVEVARIERPAGPNGSPAHLVVESCTAIPSGAPSYVRPKFARVSLIRSSGDSVSIAIRRSELAGVIAGLQQALAEADAGVAAQRSAHARARSSRRS